MKHSIERLLIGVYHDGEREMPVGTTAYDTMKEAEKDQERLLAQFSSDSDVQLEPSEVEYKTIDEWIISLFGG